MALKCDSCKAKSCGGPTPPSAIFLENLPLVMMYIIGTVICGMLWWWFGVLYLVYCILSVVIHMRFICPYCYHYNTNSCPSGFALVTNKYFKPQYGKKFRTEFKKYVGFQFPAWFIPVVAAGRLLWLDFDIVTLALIILFAIIGFGILPFVSKKYGCKKCLNRKNCPWGT